AGREIELDGPAGERDPRSVQAAAQVIGEIGFIRDIEEIAIKCPEHEAQYDHDDRGFKISPHGSSRPLQYLQCSGLANVMRDKSSPAIVVITFFRSSCPAAIVRSPARKAIEETADPEAKPCPKGGAHDALREAIRLDPFHPAAFP